MNPEFDTLSNVLDSLHICGSLLLHESYTAPWAIALPDAEQIAKYLDVPNGTRIVPFHLVERGYIEVDMKSDNSASKPPLVVEAGEMVICFQGQSHYIFQGSNHSAFPVERVFAGDDIPFRAPKENRRTSVVCLCGIFYLHDTHLNPLFASLPPILHAPVSQIETFQNLSGIANLIAQELDRPAPGSNFMVERLLELLCAGAIRSYMEKLPAQDASWLIGIRDPIISRTLAMVHAQPEKSWSVDLLAQNVQLSPSRFSARFKETLGESPMSYIAKWRIHVASRLLKTTENSVNEVALQVGYENLSAFNRAFKRHLNVSPGAWRAIHV